MPGGHRDRLKRAAVPASLVVAAVIIEIVAVSRQRTPPSPATSNRASGSEASRTTDASGSGVATTGPSGGGPSGIVLPRSVPVRLDIPRMGVKNARVVELGLATDGSMAVPPVGKDSPAGWFRGSPTPGQLGSCVIVGHVDSAQAGPAIFFSLGALKPGDAFSITRADGIVAVFRIQDVARYPKTAFPTQRVFGGTDYARACLITCGGSFDPADRSYVDNVVVFASIVSTHPAGR